MSRRPQTILVLDVPPTPDLIQRARRAAPGFTVHFEHDPPDALLAGAQIVAGHLTRPQLRMARNLRWNHLWTAGADADLSPEMVDRDVTLTTSAGNGAVPLAEHAMLLLLMLNRDAPRWFRAQQHRQWDRFRHGELAGATVGIIGMGNAGKDLAAKCGAFHMRVLGLRNRPEVPAAHVDRMFGPAEITRFAKECDYIVVTAPLTPQTEGLVNSAVFTQMRPTAALINVSRGEVVDHDALLDALTSGSIAGAGLDAHRDEPLPEESVWWSLPNVIVTPHNGATTPQTLTRAVDIFMDNLDRYSTGSPLRNVVNKEAGYSM